MGSVNFVRTLIPPLDMPYVDSIYGKGWMCEDGMTRSVGKTKVMVNIEK